MGTAQLPSVREMWELSVPEMAFEYQPLLSTLLAVAAAHHARLVPHEAEELRRVQGGFIAQAIGGHRAETAKLALSSPGAGVTETLCMNAILISLYTLACRVDGGAGGGGEYEPPNLWLNMARGVRTVVSMVYYRLVEERARIAPLLVARPVVHRGDVEVQDGGPKGSSGELRFLVYMLPGSEEKEEEEVMGVYVQCVGYLEGLLMAVRMGESGYDIRKRFSSFPSMVPGGFLGLVSELRPRALVILAYLFALAKGADGVWWLRGIPEMEVRGIESILPEVWRGVMRWPMGVVKGEVNVNDEVVL
ncbi:hypothetical protein BO83DRAFT_361389 [Aspergillus eucalypticola CBS 122712]|uniref:C6 finger domain protein n=1 Tax=Aspergillus eucalypticola (strain CBS 122712 / IBT 29274) TaxID=1448314 RepID=A0A317VE80_ASPEC|nr:uncharacterized protein BO83DRAFT_361389 [Aspergillus eucalypticola CBS 122712]PWY72673.1 hypothetical protein BO83DRAFT_361389 [Aspergillus eucalypticola CBS 122712]